MIKEKDFSQLTFSPFKGTIMQIIILTLLRMGGPKKPPASFSPVTSTTVGISPQNFLTFSFDPFATLV